MKTKLLFLLFAISFAFVVQGQNTVTIVNPPSTVTADQMVDINVDYSKVIDTAYVLIRFKSPTGDNLGQALTTVTSESGSVLLSVQAPEIADVNYSLHAQMLALETWAGLANDEFTGVTVEADAPVLENSIAIVDPETTVTAGQSVDFDINYTKDVESAIIVVRFKSPEGANLGQASTTVTQNSGNVLLSVIAPEIAGNNYSLQAQLLSSTYAGLANDEVADVTIEADAPVLENSITIVDPETTVTAGQSVDFNVNYTKQVDSAIVVVRFKSPDGTNLGQASTTVTQNSGNVLLSVIAPESAGNNYSLQAQLLSLTYAGLANNEIAGVTVEEGITVLENSIAIVDPETTVTAGQSVDFNVNYTKQVDSAIVVVRFKSPDGTNLGQASTTVTQNSGNVLLSVVAPDSAGSNYSLQAQLLSLTYAGLANDEVADVTVESNTPVLENSISIVNTPTTATQGRSVNIDLSYTKAVDTAYVLVRFKSPTGDDLDQALETITEDSGIVTLNVLAPDSVGDDYGLQAQLLSTTWAGLAEDNVAGITIEEYIAPTGDNTLEIVNTSNDAINNGSIKRVNIKYNLLQASRILVEVRDNEIAAGSNKIGQVWVDVEAGNDTVGVDLVVDSGFPGTTNRIQAVLFEGNSWTPISITETPFLLVSKGDGTITYRGQPYNYDNSQNLLFEESLGNGYYTNWFVNNGWIGDIQAKFGQAEQEAWVDWDNNGFEAGQTHAEFDIKIQKYSWHNYKEQGIERGYPSKIADIDNPVTCTYTGQWAPNSQGRTFFNMTAWLYNGGGDLNDNTYAKSDIIVHTWDNSGNLAQRYAEDPNDSLEPLDTISSGGVAYHVLKRNTGGYGEAATYNIVPYDNPRAGNWDSAFDTAPFDVSLDMKDILEKLIEVDSNSTTPTLNDQWYIHGLEWTFIGSSGDTIGGDYVGDSDAKFTLLNYTIPDLILGDQTVGENSLEIIDTSADPINNGTLREVQIKYNVSQASRILVEVRDSEDAANSNKIGQVWVDVEAGEDTVSVDLVVDAGNPGATNRIQALLFQGNTWTPITIDEIPFLLVGQGDGTITYRGQPTAGNIQNELFEQDLGEGYWTNYYIADGWEGPLQMKFEPFGSTSWIEWENENDANGGHKEFDIKIQKFSWHEWKDEEERGYPSALKDINFPLETTLEGSWSPGSSGKGQINMTAWVTENGDMSGNRVDIIVHAFDNSGNFREKYDNATIDGVHKFNNIGEFTANNGLTYQILRTLPGYIGEVASYNLIPDEIVQEDPRADYSTDPIQATIDMKDIIDNLILKESTYAGEQVPIDENWQINGLEWTVVGQSASTDTDGQPIPSGKGKFTFSSYSIPDLVGGTVPSVNALEIIDTSEEPIDNGTLREVNIKYNLLQASRILVEVRDSVDVTNSSKIGEVWVDVEAGTDTISLDLVVDAGWPRETNIIQAVLFEEESWEPISLNEIPFIVVNKGNGSITYRNQPVADNNQNILFEQDLGDGYWTNYYIADGWEGPLQMKFDAVGSSSWIEWENENLDSDDSKEFEIKIQKSSNNHDNLGYPTKIELISLPLTATLDGNWNTGSSGRSSVSLKARLTKEGDFNDQKANIIVYAFDNSGNFENANANANGNGNGNGNGNANGNGNGNGNANGNGNGKDKKYGKSNSKDKSNGQGNGHGNGSNHGNGNGEDSGFSNIGQFTSNNGLTYQVLRTISESSDVVVSYDIVPNNVIQEDSSSDFSTEVIDSTIDMKNIIDNVLEIESKNGKHNQSSLIDETWFINELGWTIVGMSESTVSRNKTIASSKGKFTFNDYMLPNLSDSVASDNTDNDEDISIYFYPNPFKNKLFYEYSSSTDEPIFIDFYSNEGRFVKRIENERGSFSSTQEIRTNQFKKGIYLVRISFQNRVETTKLIKN
ncbi:T9SS type A sorting domain-containing protein [Maribacter sp. Asnod1-A12]|uniref:T9SS type A sorting domain-containing protein n=1 Tax=Maribacter sp. Asnod1-A12 TaxID=3160576 RepID=UPI0038688091